MSSTGLPYCHIAEERQTEPRQKHTNLDQNVAIACHAILDPRRLNNMRASVHTPRHACQARMPCERRTVLVAAIACSTAASPRLLEASENGPAAARLAV